MTAARGAYALAVRLARGARLPIAGLGAPSLPAGLYLYAGSAWGPGGIAARLGRHLRRPETRHWHIDHLVAAGAVEDALAFPGGRECEIVARARGLPGAGIPVPGFGASDCRVCPAHLLSVDRALVRRLETRDSRRVPASGGFQG